MNAVIQRFRRALGGFNRNDVMQYIAQTAADHRRQIDELKAELARRDEERVGLEVAVSGLQDEKGDMTAEGAKVRASLEESTRTLTKLRGELTETEAKLRTAREELVRLQAQVAELEPMAKRYEELKDRVATVELDAHRKAQSTIDEAQRQVQELRGETKQWLGSAMEGYDGLRRGMDELFAGAKALAGLEEQAKKADAEADSLKKKVGL